MLSYAPMKMGGPSGSNRDTFGTVVFLDYARLPALVGIIVSNLGLQPPRHNRPPS